MLRVLGLLLGYTFDRLAVGGQDLDFMNIVFARVGPNQLSLASQLEGLHASLRSVACDDRVAVGKSLTTAWVCKWFLWKGLVAHFPNDLTFRIEFDTLVAVRKIDQRVAIRKPYRCEWPVLGCATSELR